MTTPDNPDFAVGMAVELRQIGSGGVDGHAEAHVGHAVPPSSVRDGNHASRAVCGTLTTVDDPGRIYYPAMGGLAFMDCAACVRQVTQAR